MMWIDTEEVFCDSLNLSPASVSKRARTDEISSEQQTSGFSSRNWLINLMEKLVEHVMSVM